VFYSLLLVVMGRLSYSIRLKFEEEKIKAQTEALRPYMLGSTIRFCPGCTGFGQMILLSGWSQPEFWGTWTDESQAKLIIRLPVPVRSDLELVAKMYAMTNGHQPQEVDLGINGKKVERWTFTSYGLNERSAVIPANLLERDRPLVITFHVLYGVAPSAINSTSDDRLLGIGIKELRIYEKGSWLKFEEEKIKAQTEALRPYMLGSTIQFCPGCAGFGQMILLSGWSQPESWGTWTDESQASLIIRLPASIRSDLELVAKMYAMTNGRQPQEVDLGINGKKVERWTFTSYGVNERSAFIPANFLERDRPLVITFHVLYRVAPSAISSSSDVRLLGIGIKELRIYEKGSYDRDNVSKVFPTGPKLPDLVRYAT
jgi:hypothetical protein